MLESEEGQLNAVFACYGSVAQHGQFLEESLTDLIVTLNELTGAQCTAENIRKWTIGRLLKHFEKRFVIEIDAWVPEYLDEGRRLRNFLIHEYFLKRKEKLRIESGRMAILEELIEIEQHLRGGANLINGLRVAIDEAVDGRKATGPEDRDVVFSVKLELERPEPIK